ncbi:maleylpyruvate isomerase N-terminal domain-containing protein [Kineococcus sp. NUM-3379]
MLPPAGDVTGEPTADLAGDLLAVVAAAADALRDTAEEEWDRPAAGSRWSCWEVGEHVVDDLLAYALQLGPRRPPAGEYLPVQYGADRTGGPAVMLHVERTAGPAGLLDVLESAGALLAAAARSVPAGRRAYHPSGLSDGPGFAAMGFVETAVHVHDVALALDRRWEPDPAACERVLRRLFPHVERLEDPWRDLLWATGRTEQPGRERLQRWRWYGAVPGGA